MRGFEEMELELIVRNEEVWLDQLFPPWQILSALSHYQHFQHHFNDIKKEGRRIKDSLRFRETMASANAIFGLNTFFLVIVFCLCSVDCIVFPKALPPGSNIAFISPASPPYYVSFVYLFYNILYSRIQKIKINKNITKER